MSNIKSDEYKPNIEMHDCELETPAAGPAESSVPAEQKTFRLALIEHDDDGRTLLEVGLAGSGYKVAAAKTGKEGIFKSLEAPPDLFLINPDLSGTMDGYRTVKLIRQIEPIRRSWVALMMDEAEKDAVVKAVREGADLCVTKGLSVHAIHMKAQQILKRPRPAAAPLYENLQFTVSAKGADTLELQVNSELNSQCGKDLVLLMRTLIPLQPFTLSLSLTSVTTIAMGVIGYLSDLKDVAKDCGGKIQLTGVQESKCPSNVLRVLKTNFQIV